MEPAKIDWQALDSVFIRDDTYENINAPQWLDLLSPDDAIPIDDEAWFCRPDCKHPKTAEDFLKSTPTSASKLLRSVSVSKIINGLSDWNRRDDNLKRRGQPHSTEDSENQDPNFHTPLRPQHQNQMKSLKEAIKSSAEKNNDNDEYHDISLLSEEKVGNEESEKPARVLKSTPSARDLFGAGGKDLFGRITEFCNELKRRIAVSKGTEKDEVEDELQDPVGEGEKCSLLDLDVKKKKKNKEEGVKMSKENEVSGVEKIKEKKPFGEVSKERLMKPVPSPASSGQRSNNINRPRRKKKVDCNEDENGENIPVSLDLNVMKSKQEERLLQIRTSPPTPQCFSDTKANTPSKGPKSRMMEKDILLQQVEEHHTSKVFREVKINSKNTIVAGAGAGGNTGSKRSQGGRTTLDVFWFLKPCALSS